MPGDRSTGRVEVLWTTVRVYVCFIYFIQIYLTPIGALVLLMLLLGAVLVVHVRILPFHGHEFNMLRGGIYALVLWAANGSAVLSRAYPPAAARAATVGGGSAPPPPLFLAANWNASAASSGPLLLGYGYLPMGRVLRRREEPARARGPGGLCQAW